MPRCLFSLCVVLLAKVNVVMYDSTTCPFLSAPFDSETSKLARFGLSVGIRSRHIPAGSLWKASNGTFRMSAATQRPSGLIVELFKPVFLPPNSVRYIEIIINVVTSPQPCPISSSHYGHCSISCIAQQATFFANEFLFCATCCSRRPIHAGFDAVFRCDQRPSQWRSSEVVLTRRPSLTAV